MRGFERVDDWLTEEACECGDPANSSPVYGTLAWTTWRDK
jgi:hypothetical protein